MWRLLFIATIAPFLIAFLASKTLGACGYDRKSQLQSSVEALLQRLVSVMGESNIVIEYVKRPLWTFPADGIVRIPAQMKESKKVADVARALILLGLVLLMQKQQAPVLWRLKMLKLGYVLPLFILLIGTFTFLLAKLSFAIVFAALCGSLSFCAAMLWFSMPVEKEAARLMVGRVEKLRLLHRLSEEEMLVDALRAGPWVSLVPGCVLRLIARG